MPSLTKLCFTAPTLMATSFAARKTPKPSSSLITAPTNMARNSCSAASDPFWPALWISDAATDSGNGSVWSSTITRLRIVTNMMPSVPPSIISAADSRYSSAMFARSNFQNFRMTKAGSVKMAPAATDSPIDPTVRAKFSSRMRSPEQPQHGHPDDGGRVRGGDGHAGAQAQVRVGRAEDDAHDQAQDEGPHREFALVGRVGHVRARARRPRLAWSRRSAS